AAGDRYRQRYRHFLRPDELGGWRIGVFEHSSVARDLLCSLLTRAGAEVVRLGRAAEFVAVDTEALEDPVFRHSRDRKSTRLNSTTLFRSPRRATAIASATATFSAPTNWAAGASGCSSIRRWRATCCARC